MTKLEIFGLVSFSIFVMYGVFTVKELYFNALAQAQQRDK